jgi:pimeloyl-ACP methyl ester carboxylesterase
VAGVDSAEDLHEAALVCRNVHQCVLLEWKGVTMDDRVASAIAHWEPRFTANGVQPADFARVTQSVEKWPDWCAAWVALGSEHEDLGREALEQGRLRSGGEHLAQAAAYYHFAKFVFVEDLEQMKAAHARAVTCYTDALPHLDPPGRKVELPFENGKLVGVIRTPYGEGPFPVVLMIPGLDSTKEELRSTEQTFLDRGLATFSVDGPGQGEAEYDVPIRGDWAPVAELLWATVGEQPDLDRARLAVWGVSLGGYYSVRLTAALGDRVTAAVALAGPFNFGECWPGLPPLTRDTFRVRSGTASDDEARAVASTLDLSSVTGDVTAPLLLVFGRLDRLIPWEQAVKVHEAIPSSELLMLEEANHGCADRSPWHRPRTADWLAGHLGGQIGDPTPTLDRSRA